MAPCLETDAYNEKWELTENQQIRQINLNMCLDYENLSAQNHIFVRKCDENSSTQQWSIGQ